MSTTPQRVHFIGIGGIGMSALARFYLHEGVAVSGSDSTATPLTKALEAEGATVAYEQVAENITDADPAPSLVVYTEAMAADHPELVAAWAAGIPTINYFEALGRVANDYYLIAVAGTHGKTTTTAMLADIMEEASYDPTVIVGSLRAKTKSNFRPGKSKYALVEACEYKRDFLYLTPDVLVITNIELDHVDYYKNIDDIVSAFRQLAGQVREGGVVVADTSNAVVMRALEGISARVVDYREALSLSLLLKAPGLHNRMNAAAATAAAAELGIDVETSNAALEAFAGTWRRFQYKGDVNGAPVYDDYAHHPSAVALTIAATRELYPKKKVVAIFEGHTFSRTYELLEDFSEALASADHVLVAPVYAARETDEGKVNAETVRQAIIKKSGNAEAFYTLDAVTLRARNLADDNTVVLVMGAGPVTKVAEDLVSSHI